MKSIFSSLILMSISFSLSVNQCIENYDCKANQCCTIVGELSGQIKRACLPILELGDECNLLTEPECGCAPGLKCETIAPTTKGGRFENKCVRDNHSECLENADCKANQCCAIVSTLPGQTQRACLPILQLDDECSIPTRPECGCAHGLKCENFGQINPGGRSFNQCVKILRP